MSSEVTSLRLRHGWLMQSGLGCGGRAPAELYPVAPKLGVGHSGNTHSWPESAWGSQKASCSSFG